MIAEVGTYSLQVGYLLQYEREESDSVAAPALHIKSVIRGFERGGHRVRMVALQNGRPHSSDDLMIWNPIDPGARGVPIFGAMERVVRGAQRRLGLPYLNLFDSRRFSDACITALAGYDVLYERYWLLGFGGLMAARRMGIPIVLEVNGDIFEEYRQQEIHLSSGQWAALHALNWWLFRGVDHVVTVSEPLRRRTIDRWRLDPAKVTTVSNGAEVDLFASRETGADAKARFGLGDGPVVAFVGSFRPWHGLEILVEAFTQVVVANPTARLLLVGDGPVRSELQSRVSDLGLSDHVMFTGEVPHAEVARLLGSADIAVVSPRSSGASLYQSPLKLFEYMAAGKAIIAPAVPNIEQVATHGVDAVLVPPEDPMILGRAMVDLLRDAQLRSALGQAARTHALERHSWSRTTSELESILVSLLRKPPVREKILARR